jgi:hypothetical protein
MRYIVLAGRDAPKTVEVYVPTVQEAVDRAGDGDTIVIGPDTLEQTIDLRPLIGKRVEIRGEPKLA